MKGLGYFKSAVDRIAVGQGYQHFSFRSSVGKDTLINFLFHLGSLTGEVCVCIYMYVRTRAFPAVLASIQLRTPPALQVPISFRDT
jgi:hypothetical protein